MMTFDEWLRSGQDEVRWDDAAGAVGHVIWQAAQKEAAKRCADLADEHEEGPSARPAIEREFGLDKS